MNLIAFLLTLLSVAVTVTVSCSGNKAQQATNPASETSFSGGVRPTALSREAAVIRSKQVNKVSYKLMFYLAGNRDEFEGKTSVQFDLKARAREASKDLFLDFSEGSLRTVTVNGKQIDDLTDKDRYDGNKIHFPLSELKTGTNTIEIAYSHPFSKDGSGLHKFVDPADQRVYLYSDFEPYDAHRVFPCFDQPDLKATYELTAEVPEDWQVVSSTLPKEINGLPEGRKVWIFPQTLPFSTYVFSLHAGPYHVWKSTAKEIPLRLLARKSLAKYVDKEEWFEITRAGLDFFSIQFGVPYPFGKYDQVIVPDFNSGAMENVGAVTFSERFVYRTAVTLERRRGRASTILHEMAHMWFGNLVTMRWWNGLWLNESFASFMAAWATDEATKFKGSWQAFFHGDKGWAYTDDQLVTTHPIELPVADTDVALTNFDGITYGKGAAALKQLRYFLGDDDFREGLQRYFQRFSFKNTTLADFVRMLSEASSQDVGRWQRAWLQSSGVNTVRADWACEPDARSGKSRISKLNLVQSGGSELRPHKSEVAFFRFPKGQSKLTAPLVADEESFPVLYSSEETPVRDALKEPCPDLVFPNFRDLDYVKVELDDASLKVAKKHLSQIQDAFTRQMLWHTLWEMVIDGKLSAAEYGKSVLKHVGAEKDAQVLGSILKTMVGRGASDPSVLKFLSGEQRKKFATHVESFYRQQFNKASAGSDFQLIWYNHYLNAIHNRAGLNWAHRVLAGKENPKGMELDQERRWDLILVLARNGAKDARELIAAELENDSTDIGQKTAITAEVSIPDAATKKEWLEKIANGSMPVPKLKPSMGAFYLLGQEELTANATDTYFDTVARLSASLQKTDEQLLTRFAWGMFPPFCEEQLVQRATDFLSSHSNLHPAAVKAIKIGRQQAERCIRARTLAMPAPASATSAAPAQPDSDPSPSPHDGDGQT